MKIMMRRGDAKKVIVGTSYFMVLYDFVASNPARNRFYEEAAKLLGRRVGKQTSSYSAIQVLDRDTAHKLFDLTVKCNAQSSLLISAVTLDSFHKKATPNDSQKKA